MKSRCMFAVAFAALLLAGFSLATSASAQTNAKPRFAVLPPHSYSSVTRPAAGQLSQWNGAYSDKGNRFRFTQVGPDPRKTNSTTTVTTFIIPVKMVYGSSNGNMTFDPSVPNFGSQTSVQVLQSSPLLSSNVDFVQGGVDLGTTQYIDAFQRGNFWKFIQTNNQYHVLLGNVSVLPEETINVTSAQGSVITNPFLPGHNVGTMDINAFDAKLQGFLGQLSQVTPDTLPIFVTYNVYLTEGGCCIGGFHSALAGQPGGQTYSYTTMVDQGSGVFSQDVAAASHEIGEWMDDPFIDNSVPCTDNSIMEDGDPLVLDDHAYPVNGFTYHLQDLVFIDYFGAPKGIPVNHWISFQNDKKSICPGG